MRPAGSVSAISGGVVAFLLAVGCLLVGLVGVGLAAGQGSGTAAGLAGGAMLVPALAAAVVRWCRREGYANAGLGLGAGLRWYAAAWTLPVGMVALDFGWLLLLGEAAFDPSPERLAVLSPSVSSGFYDSAIPGLSGSDAVVAMAVASLTVANVPMIVAGFGEEFGWRGYLLPRLLPWGVWPAFVAVGLIWWAWHLPLSLLAPDGVAVSPLVTGAGGIAGAILFGAVLGWLRYAGESIWVPALAHIAYNNAAGAGHLLFDVDLDAIVVARVVDAGLVCLALGAVSAFSVVPRVMSGTEETSSSDRR